MAATLEDLSGSLTGLGDSIDRNNAEMDRLREENARLKAMATTPASQVAARMAWNAATQTIVGVDSDGNEATSLTPMGGYAMASGAPLWIYAKQLHVAESPAGKMQREAAAFLRRWADLIDGGSKSAT